MVTVCAALFAFATVAIAQEKRREPLKYGISARGDYGMYVMDGKPYMTRELDGGSVLASGWEVRKPDYKQPSITTIVLFQSGGLGLCYDLSGKDKKVVLGRPTSELSDKWKVTLKPPSYREEFLVQAAYGELAGWYLDGDQQGEEFTYAPWNKKYVRYRMTLTEKPVRVQSYPIYTISK